MQREDIIRLVEDFIARDPGNVISGDYALRPDLAGVRMYDAPRLRFGDAEDPYFDRLREPGVIGPHFQKPEDWLPGARTVISVFLPFSREVRVDNRADMSWPSPAWLHARIEGQEMIVRLTRVLRDTLRDAGHAAVAPLLDERFRSRGRLPNESGFDAYTSNWSERHAAFICGHGTFGLSKGLITHQGVAGRFTSVITDRGLPVDGRSYTGIYEHCSRCGACVDNCPADAISLEAGKDHEKCALFLAKTRAECTPRYGCGKCQVKVPCETKACVRAAP